MSKLFSEEDERCALGCSLIAANGDAESIVDEMEWEWFEDERHREIFGALLSLKEDERQINPVELDHRLRANPKHAEVAQYALTIPDLVPSAANFPTYRDALKDLALRRAKEKELSKELAAVRDTSRPFAADLRDAGGVELMSFADGLTYDTSNDPNTLIGMKGGKTTRYLGRGQGAWVIAPSGVGKSVMLLQMGALFALGRPVFGITPVRPLKVLGLQAENDRGDNAEMMQGISSALECDELSEDFETLNDNFKVITEREQVGRNFCSWLGRKAERFKADLVLVDPLLSFAGIDVSRQDQCSQFLRQWLNPMLSHTGVGLIAAHHTGKPKAAKETRNWTAIDYAYAGLGSSELVNWARAVSVIVPHGEFFELKLLKRGSRAGATHPNGEPTTTIWLRHSTDRLWWNQVNPPEEPEPGPGNPGGRPSKVDQALALGLGRLIDTLTTPISKNELARQIEAFTGKAKLDISLSVCKLLVERLVANGAIKKEDGKYVKA